MALFKVYSGIRDNFPQDYPLHPGYAYFFEDDGIFTIDTENERKNVAVSEIVRTVEGRPKSISTDKILWTEDEPTPDCLVVSGKENIMYYLPIDNNSVVIKNNNGGLTGISGEGALYSIASEAPSFGTLPISAGGTGATTAADARSNLDVYSKSEVDAKTAGGVSTCYAVLIKSTDWTLSGNYYVYNYNNTNLKCGSSGKIPPIIRCRTGQESYNKINKAVATAGSGIQFKSSGAITENILIDIIDVG